MRRRWRWGLPFPAAGVTKATGFCPLYVINMSLVRPIIALQKKSAWFVEKYI